MLPDGPRSKRPANLKNLFTGPLAANSCGVRKENHHREIATNLKKILTVAGVSAVHSVRGEIATRFKSANPGLTAICTSSPVASPASALSAPRYELIGS